MININVRADKTRPIVPIMEYMVLHPKFLIIKIIKLANPAPKKYPEFSMLFAVDLISGGKLAAIN